MKRNDLKEICEDVPIVFDYCPVEHKMSLGKKIAILSAIVGGSIVAGTITCKYLVYLGDYYILRSIHFENLMP
ncbi:MAG: hypothetical protein AABX29_07640 [Nanoarchaeota archaeon]